MKRVVEERIQLNQNTSGMVETDATAAVETDIIAYTVPDNSEIIFNPADFVALYLEDNATTPAELAAATRVRVVLTDPLSRRTKTIAEGEYTVFKEFQDSTKKYYFGQRVVCPANFIILIKVTPVATVDASDCRYTLSCTNIYETLD